MARGFGQYCPLALAVELLGERWTILIVSRLIDGCTRFNDIHRGVPRISATLLSKRLVQLEDAGIISREPLPGERGHRYQLTQAGTELESIINSLAVWGQRWARDMDLDDLDPAFLAWSIHTRIELDAMPFGRTVIEFEFTGTPTDFRRFWLVVNDDKIDMCLKHPGYESDLIVRADLRLFVEAWRGIRSLHDEIKGGAIKLEGPSNLCIGFPAWLQLSALAPFERAYEGRERTLAQARTN